MEPMSGMGSNVEMGPMEGEETPEMTPIDQIISRVDGYIQNPASVTPETLMELKAELEDLRMGVESEDMPPEPPMDGLSGEVMQRGGGF